MLTKRTSPRRLRGASLRRKAKCIALHAHDEEGNVTATIVPHNHDAHDKLQKELLSEIRNKIPSSSGLGSDWKENPQAAQRIREITQWVGRSPDYTCAHEVGWVHVDRGEKFGGECRKSRYHAWKSIRVKRKPVYMALPKPHMDFVEMETHLHVPLKLVGKLSKISTSVSYAPARKSIIASCNSVRAIIATLSAVKQFVYGHLSLVQTAQSVAQQLSDDSELAHERYVLSKDA